jgi:cyanophycinase
VNGVIALVGSGEFTPAMDDIDRDLLASTGRDRPRVAIVPAASWPDGETVFRGWAERGDAHFSALGAEAVPVLITDRESADDASAAASIARADIVYFSGGKPGYLLSLLRDTAAGAALREAYAGGAVIAGCSAGAMVLGGHQPQFGGRGFLRPPFGWQDGLSLVPGLVVIPHYDAIPEMFIAPLSRAAPKGAVVVGIDENTALVGRDGSWQVQGAGRVTVWRGRRRERHVSGEAISL